MTEQYKLERFFDDDDMRHYALSEEDFFSGKFWVGVSAILDVATHAKLKNWFKNNSAAYIKSHSENTANIGTEIHNLIEADLKGETINVPDEMADAMDHWYRVKSEHGIVATATEQGVYSNKYGYAGTFDILGEYDGKLSVMDIKTGSYSIKTGWQLAAYKYALEEQGEYSDLGMVGINIHRNGKIGKPYTYERYEECYVAFLSCLNVFRMMYWNKLKDMQWHFLTKPLLVRAGK